mgnify:CR=1 FL=1
MKNEILAKAITEIDDDLLTEAREPIKKKQYDYRVITRYVGALAACFVLVFTFVYFGYNGSGGPFDVAINGQSLADSTDNVVVHQIALHTGEPSVRDKNKMTVPLEVKANGETVITAADGGIICTADGTEHQSLKTTSDISIRWLLDVTRQDRADLTVTSGKQTLVITAEYDAGHECLTVSAKKIKN